VSEAVLVIPESDLHYCCIWCSPYKACAITRLNVAIAMKVHYIRQIVMRVTNKAELVVTEWMRLALLSACTSSNVSTQVRDAPSCQ
jgi:hypothetical protein